LAELVADPERRARLGVQARLRAERLSHDDVYAGLERLYRELTEPAGSL
jgi:hypothetical protein